MNKNKRAHDLAIAYVLCCYGNQYPHSESAKSHLAVDDFAETYQEAYETFVTLLSDKP